MSRKLRKLLKKAERDPELCAYLEQLLDLHIDNAEEAHEFYTDFHWGNQPSHLSEAMAPLISPGERLPVLGQLRMVEYLTTKGDESAIWFHAFQRPRPVLAFHQGSERLVILGGGYTVNERGIVG